MNRSKILLVDTSPILEEYLRDNGCDASRASLGPIVQAPISEGRRLIAVAPGGDVPENAHEFDLVIVDLAARNIENVHHLHDWEMRSISNNWDDHWRAASAPSIDTRPLVLSSLAPKLDKYFCKGMMIVVFVDRFLTEDFVYGDLQETYHIQVRLREKRHISARGRLYGFPLSDDIKLIEQHGEHVTRSGEGARLQKNEFYNRLYRDFGAAFTYRSVINFPQQWLADSNRESAPQGLLEKMFGGHPRLTTPQTITARAIFSNKYSETVGLEIIHGDSRGCMILMPQAQDSVKVKVVERLVREHLKTINPEKEFVAREWLSSDCMLPGVAPLRREEDVARNNFEETVARISKKINATEEEYSWMWGLVLESDAPLVQSVIKALHCCGMNDAVDSDSLSGTSAKKEDVTVMSEFLVVEVKGKDRGLAINNDIDQIVRRVAQRRREWEKPLVRGLLIVNHQRFDSPLQREERSVFRDEHIEMIAEDGRIGLMSGWDLFCLIRNYIELDWPKEILKKTLLQPGWCRAIPAHYVRIGKIESVQNKATRIYRSTLEADEPQVEPQVKVGVRLAIQTAYGQFVESNVLTLRCDGRSTAKPNQIFSFTMNSNVPLKKGMEIFQVCGQKLS